MDQGSTTSQMAFSRNAMIITSIVLVGIGIIILLAVIFSSNSCNCPPPPPDSFDKPPEVEYDDIQLTHEETNGIAKNEDLATVEDRNSRNVGVDTSDLSTVEDVKKHHRHHGTVETATLDSSVSGTDKTEDTTGETVSDDSSLESVSNNKKRKRDTTDSSSSESFSSDFSSPTDKSH